ncbi:MAG: MBL fold metallo-hydrolase [Actinomycetota bacterium]|nr:MBL fold metallo-hydrolase [Actinomycetota bacterium]
MANGEVVFLSGNKGGRFPYSNCLFIDDEKSVIIDPAAQKEKLIAISRDKNDPLVVNTHYHIDHIRYDSLFERSPVAAHPLDAKAIASIDENAHLVGVEGLPWENEWKQWMMSFGFPARAVEMEVNDGDELCLGKLTLRFIHTPGHTPGHICVEIPEKKSVFLADIDLTKFGPWYGNKYSDIDDFVDSIERMKQVEAETWYTSHEAGVLKGDISRELERYGRVIEQRDERILDALSKPLTSRQMVEKALIYGKSWEPIQMFIFFEGVMLEKHLERLEKEGLVFKEDDLWMRAGG